MWGICEKVKPGQDRPGSTLGKVRAENRENWQGPDPASACPNGSRASLLPP